MAGSIATLNAALRWDLTDFDRGTAHVEGAFGKLRAFAGGVADAWVSAGQRMTLGISAPLAALGGFSIKAASDAQELQSAYDYTFGRMADSMNAWAVTTGDTLGRSTTEMKQFALAFGPLLQQAAPTEEAAASMSQSFAQLAQDASSFFNVSPDEAMERIRAGLTGEAEPLRRFGVFLSEAEVKAKGLELGLIKVGQELNEQGKIMSRAALIADGLSVAQGDVERTSDSFANRVRALRSNVQELTEEIGQKLLPIAERFVGWAQGAVQWLSQLPQPVKDLAFNFAVMAVAVGPAMLVLSTLAKLVLPLLLVRMGGVFLAISAVLNPLGTAFVLLSKFALSWEVIGAVLGRIAPLFLRFLGPVGLAITLISLFGDKIVKAFGDAWAQAQKALGPPLQALMGKVGRLFESVGRAFDLLAASKIGQLFGELIGLIGDVIYWLIRLGGLEVITAIQGIIDLLGILTDYVADSVDVISLLIEGKWETAWEKAKNAVARAVISISNKIKGLLPTLSYALGLIGALLGYEGEAGKPIIEKPQTQAEFLAEIKARTGGKGGRAFSGDGKDYALPGTPKKSRTARGRAHTGPTQAELAAQREEIRLSQALAVARERGEFEAERAIQRQVDLNGRIDQYKRAGLALDQARLAAQKDMAEIDQARAVANAKAIAQEERALDIQLAEMRGDYAHQRALEDEEFIEKKILFYQQQGKDLVDAQLLAQSALAHLEEARAEIVARRLADQERERQIELARLRGDDPNRIAAMEADLRRRDRVAELMRDGKLSESDAVAQATREGLDRERAYIQGTFRDTIKAGFRAAFDGNLGDFFKTWLKESMFNALNNVLNRLADGLASMLSRASSGSSGGGGILGTLFGVATSIFGAVSSSGAGMNTGGSNPSSLLAGMNNSRPGFASGGSFRIKGFPGIDRNTLSLNGNPVASVSSGEIMDVRRGQPANDGGGGVVEIRLMDEMLDARIESGSVRVVRAASPGIAEQGAMRAIDMQVRTHGRAG
ncbi:hypothetical protein FSZ31_04400 [Sphingorhabdus soli]|uniref:Phage tail tape measure protein n=1 Tax=Flavisphingopyxis soli TaxID=2601267 RepID=A0A5C6USU7_9SPHN|nr:hypothetical protein [Sphingorhabdus soli]TXC73968.1 hypothetical protein FSZ31_04400 [Sphingorhabdus soli]